MTTINPYLTFNGNCEEAFKFYQSVFGGAFPFMGRFKDMPDNPDFPIPEAEKEKIMHVSLPISKETTLMGSDSSEAFGHVTAMGNNFSISINTDSQEEATRLFNELSAGGKINMPLNKTFWGAYFGMFTDKFGIHWMVNYELPEHKEFEKNNK
jgi:PhnB protein